MSKIFNFLLSKSTLRFLDEKLIISNDLEYLLQVLDVLIKCLAVYQNVIHEHKDTLSHQWCKYFVH